MGLKRLNAYDEYLMWPICVVSQQLYYQMINTCAFALVSIIELNAILTKKNVCQFISKAIKYFS